MKRRTVLIVLLAPVAAHFIALGFDMARLGGPAAFLRMFSGGFDLAVMVLVLAYTALSLFVAGKPSPAMKFMAVTWSILLSVALFEVTAFFLGVTPPVPWPPVKRIAIAANTMPGVHGEIRFSTTGRGVRAPDGLWPRDREDRILCVGGSTTECLYVTDEKSWPWLLGTRLSQALGRPILVANAGKSGHFTVHHRIQLADYIHARRFGRVIILCGINDMGTYLRNNYEDRVRNYVNKEALVVPGGAWYRRLTISILVSRRIDGLLLKADQRKQDPAGHWYALERRLRRELLASNPVTTVPDGLPEALLRYEKNILGIIEICRKNDQKLLFLTQPTVYGDGMDPEMNNWIWQHTNDSAHSLEVLDRVAREHNDVLLRVCRENGVDCLDLTTAMPKDTTAFYDDCHFNINGCAMVVEHLKNHLAPDMARAAGAAD